MYSMIRSTLGALGNTSIGGYAKVAQERVKSYRQSVAGLREAATATVQARRDAAVQFVLQYQEVLGDIVGDRREALGARVEQVKAVAADVVTAQRTRIESAVKASSEVLHPHVERARSAATSATSRLTSSLTAVTESGLGYATTSIAAVLKAGLRVERAARDMTPPAMLEAVDKRTEQVKPYVAKAVETAAAVDRRLGGFGTALVTRVSSDVSQKLQAGKNNGDHGEEPSVPAPTAA